MRIERLVIEDTTGSFTFEPNRRFTVVGGIDELERQGLTHELTSCLGPARPGVHVEITDDGGGTYAIVRPPGHPPMMVDVDAEQAVTEQFLDARGRLDILSRLGLSERRLDRLALDEETLDDLLVDERKLQHLAGLDQTELWRLHRELTASQDRLDSVIDQSTTDRSRQFTVAEEIEHVHDQLAEAARAEAKASRVGRVSTTIAILSILPAWHLFGPLACVLLVLVAVGLVGMVWQRRRRVDALLEAAESALADAGASSYLGFHLRRLSEMFGDQSENTTLLEAAQQTQEQLSRWRHFVGLDIDPTWAAQRRHEVDSIIHLHEIGGAEDPQLAAETEATVIGRAILDRIDEIAAATGGERLPLVLDDALARLGPAAKYLVLDELLRASVDTQLIYLTADPDVAEWARDVRRRNTVLLLEPAGRSTQVPVGAQPTDQTIVLTD